MKKVYSSLLVALVSATSLCCARVGLWHQSAAKALLKLYLSGVAVRQDGRDQVLHADVGHLSRSGVTKFLGGEGRCVRHHSCTFRK